MSESTSHEDKDFHLTGREGATSSRMTGRVDPGAAALTKDFERFRRFLTGHRWELIIAAGALAFVLGLIGYYDWLASLHLHDPDHVPAPNAGDVMFDSAALFILGAAQGTAMPVVLEIARLLAPLVVGSAAVIALISLSRDRLQRMRITGMDGHVVVCGLGQVGNQFLHQARAEGLQTVVIEFDAANPKIEMCRRLRIPVIVGDAQREDTLRSAAVEHAARLFALGPSDAVNAEIVAVAKGLAMEKSRAALRCLARIGDPELCALLRIEEASLTDEARSSSLDFFNLDDIAARAWLQESPFARAKGQPHILVSRLDGLGTSLVTLAAARWYGERTDSTQLWITVVDDRSEERIDALVDQCPGLKQACRFFHCSTSVPDLRGLAARLKEAEAPPLTQAYVTADSDELALETALGLHHHFDRRVPLSVEMWQTSGVGRLISKTHTGGRTRIEVFPSLQAACTRELVRGGSFNYFEAIAMAIHEHWRVQQHDNEPLPPHWDDLDESRKESSRAQARDIPVKLESLGYEIAAIEDSTRTAFPGFVLADIERLARDEHKRWIRERVEDGWQQAGASAQKDVPNKKTKDLVPFDDLPREDQDFDRNAISTIPAVLTSVGYQTVLKEETAEQDDSHPARRDRRRLVGFGKSPVSLGTTK